MRMEMSTGVYAPPRKARYEPSSLAGSTAGAWFSSGQADFPVPHRLRVVVSTCLDYLDPMSGIRQKVRPNF